MPLRTSAELRPMRRQWLGKSYRTTRLPYCLAIAGEIGRFYLAFVGPGEPVRSFSDGKER